MSNNNNPDPGPRPNFNFHFNAPVTIHTPTQIIFRSPGEYNINMNLIEVVPERLPNACMGMMGTSKSNVGGSGSSLTSKQFPTGQFTTNSNAQPKQQQS